MRKGLFFVAAVFLSLFTVSPVKAQDTVQIFGGYSYLRPSVSIDSFVACPVGVTPPCVGNPGTLNTHPNLNGWELSGTYNFRDWLGGTADFSGHYGTDQGSSVHYQTYLFGPQVHLPGPVSPFAHVLIGGAHESISTGSGNAVSGSGSAFAIAAGAGIDIHAAPFLSVRVFQIDYLVTRFGSATQSQPRLSAGIVLHF